MALKVVIDTNVVIAGLQSRKGVSHVILQKMGTDSFNYAISNALIYEYEEVIHRMRDQSKLSLSPEDIETFLTFIAQQGIPQPIYVRLRPRLQDPKDEHILELAFNAGCSHIITFNTRDFHKGDRPGVSPALELNIQPITPGNFLSLIGGV